MALVPSAPRSLVRSRAKVLAREHREMKQSLVRLRREAGMTQQDVADRLGVSKQAVQKLERYDADPKLSTLRRYANAVGALIEHEVYVDRGQSILLSEPSAWAMMESATMHYPVSGRAITAPLVTDQKWSETASGRHFALRAA